jgi:hypothetical protein
VVPGTESNGISSTKTSKTATLKEPRDTTAKDVASNIGPHESSAPTPTSKARDVERGSRDERMDADGSETNVSRIYYGDSDGSGIYAGGADAEADDSRFSH